MDYHQLNRKTIIIFSDDYDLSTNDVIDWLHHTNQHFLRVKSDTLLENSFHLGISNESSEYTFDFEGVSINQDQLNSLWYRRTKQYNLSKFIKKDCRPENKEQVLNVLFDELRYARNAFYNLTLLDKKWLNHPFKSIIDKSEVLLLAKEIGILFPETIISNSKSKVKDFLKRYKDVIVKPIYNVSQIKVEDISYLQYTFILNCEIFQSLPDSFFPSLFQKQIKKKYEIRTFYLNGDFYSMAMFSQSKQQTQIDFRRYDYADPNRTVPYKLNSEIEGKLRMLMEKLELNCGSIDLIRDINNELYFLEVNPVGQFGMTSYPCNYYIEKSIAEYLTN